MSRALREPEVQDFCTSCKQKVWSNELRGLVIISFSLHVSYDCNLVTITACRVTSTTYRVNPQSVKWIIKMY